MRRLLVLSGTLLASMLAATSSASANDDAVLCNGTATGIAVNGDVTVPSGGACRLVDSSVRGDVKVRGDAYFQASNTTVRGDVKGKKAQTIFVEGGSSVRGNIEGDRTDQVFVFASTVRGSIEVNRATDRVNVCGNTVQGGIAVQDSGRDILVGDPLALDCPGNVVKRGDISVEGNFTDVELVVRGNTLTRGDLDVKRNHGPSDKFVQNNAGGGRIDCRANDTAFTASGNTGWHKQTGQCASP